VLSGGRSQEPKRFTKLWVVFGVVCKILETVDSTHSHSLRFLTTSFVPSSGLSSDGHKVQSDPLEARDKSAS